MRVARRHHYVPQFYLKGFTAERRKKRQLVVFDGKDRKSYTTAIDNVGLERDFNRVEIEGLEADAFEKVMASFEGQVAPALDRIIAAGAIQSDEDRFALVNLICALSLRNPRLRETIRDFHERVAKQMLGLMLQTPERWAAQLEKIRQNGSVKDPASVSHEDMKKFARGDKWKVTVPTGRHIQLELQTFEKLLPFFLKRNWLVVRAPKNSGGFVTSDHPVVLTWSDPEMRRGFYPPGFGLRGTAVLFPVCTRMAVAGAFEDKGIVIDIIEDAVAGFNGAQVAYSERQVYARDYHFKYSMQPDEEPQKGSRLIDDKRFRKPATVSYDLD